MGIILIAFLFYFFAIIVFIVAAIIIAKSIKFKNKIFTSLLSIIIISIIGYYVCIYQAPIKSTEQQKKEYLLKSKAAFQTNKADVLNILKNGQFYFPTKKIVDNDQSAIKNWFLQFINKDFDSIISNIAYQDSVEYTFDQLIGGLDKSTYESFKKSKMNTFKINHLSYSPDYRYLICFVSFEDYLNVQKPVSLTDIIYIGLKKNKTIELYCIYRQRENWVLNQESGFFKALLSISNQESKFSDKLFWSKSNYFEKHTFNKRKYFYFQLCNRGNNVFTNIKNTQQEDLVLKKPIIVRI
jgi:hypothetical protein